MPADNYKEFDTSSIITSNGSVSIAGKTFKKKELILGVIAAIACVIIIILAIALAVEASKASDCKSTKDEVASQSQSGGAQLTTTTIATTKTTANPITGSTTANPITSSTTAEPLTSRTTEKPCETKKYCETVPCLQTAAHAKEIMDEKVDPCDDFYKYACGKYADAHPITPILTEVTPFSEILFENTENLVYLLGDPVLTRDEYEQKLKDFMFSCENHFDKMKLGSRPLIDKIIKKKLGGWSVFGTFDPEKFDLNSLLKTTHIDFWTVALFNTYITPSVLDFNDHIIELTSGGTVMPFNYYPDAHNKTKGFILPNHNKVFEDYKNYIRNVSTELSNDEKNYVDNEQIETFVNDVTEVEDNIAYFASLSPINFDAHSHDQRKTLKEMKTLTEDTIDFTGYFKVLLKKASSVRAINDNTKIAISQSEYFKKLGAYLKEQISTDDGKRKVHNYFVWQLLHGYIVNLGMDYIHLKRNFEYEVYNHKDTSSGYLYCFLLAENRMRDAMNALYVKHHMKERVKSRGTEIIKSIKDEFLKQVTNKFTWLSSDDRRSVIKRLNEGLYKVGFSDVYSVAAKVDNIYTEVTIMKDDFFGNVLELNKIAINNFNKLYANSNDPFNARAKWAYHSFEPVVEYWPPWHELIVTGAVLQKPLFNFKGPYAMNMGSVGGLVATNLIHAADEYGSVHALDGSAFQNWWSNVTLQRYKKLKDCATMSQANKTIGPLYNYYGIPQEFQMNEYGQFLSNLILAQTSGVKLAYYTMKSSQNPTDLPPGLEHLSPEKLFFLGYAQSHCQNTFDAIKLDNLYSRSIPPSRYLVNTALANLKEFRDVWKCSDKSKMVYENTTCTLF